MEAAGGEWGAAPVGDGLAARVRVEGGRSVRVVKPLTYMNLSGEMVSRLARYFRIESRSLLVVCDDFSLPLGRLRLRGRGSAGGQKGLDSILRLMGTQEVPRLRIGIGPVPPGRDPADFVLGTFRPEEREAAGDAAGRAASAARVVCETGLEAAMNEYNRKDA